MALCRFRDCASWLWMLLPVSYLGAVDEKYGALIGLAVWHGYAWCRHFRILKKMRARWRVP